MNRTVGQHVEWKSQAQGYTKVKRGEIIEVVPARVRPSTEKYPDLASYGWIRTMESYVVSVPRIGKRGKNLAPKVYWPVVSILRSVAEAK